jgi:hypothetical protein
LVVQTKHSSSNKKLPVRTSGQYRYHLIMRNIWQFGTCLVPYKPD